MKTGFRFLVAVGAASGVACSDDNSTHAEADLLASREMAAAVRSFPTVEEIDRACNEAVTKMIREAEEAGAIFERTYESYFARAPHCEWVKGAVAATARCKFEQASTGPFPILQQSEAEARSKLRESDWRPMVATFVYGPAITEGWNAPKGCQRVPEPG
jgi:hypothetical protein